MPEQVGANLSLFKVTQEDAMHSARGEEPGQTGLSHREGQIPDIVTVANEHVEGVELNLLVVLARVQAIEVRSTIDAEQHGFAVDHKGALAILQRGLCRWLTATDPGSRASTKLEIAPASLHICKCSDGAANSETLPTTVEVTSMAPSATPTRTLVRVYTRCCIHSRCRIDRVFFNHHSRRRYNDGAANHEGLGNDGSQLLDNNGRRSPVLVRPRIAFAVASEGQIGGHCWRGKS